MGSYLVRALDGEYYLWENQQDILFKLGRTREEVQSKLKRGTDWNVIQAIDPHGIREAGKHSEESEARWREYFFSLRRQYSQ